MRRKKRSGRTDPDAVRDRGRLGGSGEQPSERDQGNPRPDGRKGVMLGEEQDKAPIEIVFRVVDEAANSA
ncbi:MAG: hypothetical protein ACLR4Z_04280 [Butyricicoccaceae bacterium]